MHFGLLFFFCSTPDANTLVRRRCSTQSGYQPSGKQHSCTHTHIKTTYIIEGYHWIWFLFCLSVAFAGEFHTRGVSLAQQSIESVSTARTYIKKNLLNQHVHRVVAFVWTEMRWINRRKKKRNIECNGQCEWEINCCFFGRAINQLDIELITEKIFPVMMSMVPWEYRFDFCRIYPMSLLNVVLARG